MSEIERFRYHTPSKTTAVSAFRQLVSNGGIKFTFPFVTVELKEDDLRRVHDIIHEIDDRRVFYDHIEDEIPEYMVQSVARAKEAIHEARKGLWANDWAREVVQRLLHDLGAFLTKAQQSVPRNHHDPGFAAFEEAALELRLRVWTMVAHLVVVFGRQVKPLHLPIEILQTVQEAYEVERARNQ